MHNLWKFQLIPSSRSWDITSFVPGLDHRNSRNFRIFAQSEKVEYLQKSLTSPLSAWTIHRPTFQLYCVKIWCNSIQQEPRYYNFCTWTRSGEKLSKSAIFGWLIPERVGHSQERNRLFFARIAHRNPYLSRGLSKIQYFLHFHWPEEHPGNCPSQQLHPGTCLQP